MNAINAYSNYKVSNSGINQDKIRTSLAESKQVVSDNIESNTMTKLIAGSKGDKASKFDALLLIPVLNYGDKLVDKFIGGPENKSLLKRIANFGDKVSNALHLDKIFSEKRSSKIANFIKNNRFTKYFTDEFAAVSKSPFANRSSLAETCAKELDSHAQELLSGITRAKFDTNLGELVKRGATSLSDDTVKILKEIGPLKKELTPEFLGSVMDSLSEAIPKLTNAGYKFTKKDIKRMQAIEKAIQEYAMNPESVSKGALQDSIASILTRFSDLVKKTGGVELSRGATETLASVATPKKYTTEQILSVVEDMAKNDMAVVSSDKLSILKNKAKASSKQMGDTLLGKNLAKGTLKTKDIVTYGGGIISLYFTATALSQAIKAAKEAPKGEKKSTFFHVISEQYLGFILFGPSIQMLYKAGGNKYRGMTAEARQALKTLIQNTNIDENITREGIKVAKLQRDLLLKGVDKNKVAKLAGKGFKEAKSLAKSMKGEGAKLKFWERPLKFMGRVLDMGLDKIQKPTFIKNPLNGKKIKLPKPTMKGFVGGLGRALIIMMVIQPFIQKPITKLCHKIFGEPKTYLKKQAEAGGSNNPDNQQNNTSEPVQNLAESQPQTVLQQPTASTYDGTSNLAETNLLKRWTKVPANNNQQGESKAQPAQQNQDVAAAFNLFKKEDKTQSRYIPSTEPFVPQDNEAEILAQVEPSIKRAQQLIKEAEGILK